MVDGNTQHRSPRIWLATVDGRRVDMVPAVVAPETPLVISFQGLTEDQEKAALAAFPGGKRFILEREAS